LRSRLKKTLDKSGKTLTLIFLAWNFYARMGRRMAKSGKKDEKKRGGDKQRGGGKRGGKGGY
jgi:hypothetical protein